MCTTMNYMLDSVNIEKEFVDSFPIGWTTCAIIYFTGEVSIQVEDGPIALKKRIKETSDSFMHTPFGWGYRSVSRPLF